MMLLPCPPGCPTICTRRSGSGEASSLPLGVDCPAAFVYTNSRRHGNSSLGEGRAGRLRQRPTSATDAMARLGRRVARSLTGRLGPRQASGIGQRRTSL